MFEQVMRRQLQHHHQVLMNVIENVIMNGVWKTVYKDNNSILIFLYYSVNGGWGPWEAWGECSVSCGGGEKMKNRRCDSPPPSNGGKDCRGKSTMTKRCNRKSCCMNVWPKRQCRKAKRQGKCTTDASVQDNCKKTCKICN